MASNDPYLSEAVKILADIGAALPDGRALSRAQRAVAEVLQKAERRGREASGRGRESSG
ncbi:MAG TPA: hypothetical protein VHK66_00555 [Microvirga sp.]|jgi:hypothetical protein|nr:hypothetical protein [Microvirga sp.]